MYKFPTSIVIEKNAYFQKMITSDLKSPKILMTLMAVLTGGIDCFADSQPLIPHYFTFTFAETSLETRNGHFLNELFWPIAPIMVIGIFG